MACVATATATFRDLTTGEYRLVGERFDVTDARARELVAAGVASVEGKAAKKTKKKADH